MGNELKNIFLFIGLNILLFVNHKDLRAQQDPMFTQYMNNILSVNPAYAGSRDMLSMQVISRNQWVAFDGAPVTQALSLHTPFTKYHMGVGLSLLKDQLGPVSQTGAYVDYSYSLDFTEGRYLSFGLKGGINFYEAALTDLSTVDPNDPIFVNDINRKFLPNFGLGLFYYTDRFFAGLSVPKILQNVINEHDFSSEFLNKERIHYFLMTGYVFDINRIIKFKPYFLAKYVQNAPVSIDLTAQLLFYERLWLGAMWRVGDAVGLMMQLQLTSQLRVGYSYDVSANALSTFNNGTHEILIGWDFNFGRGRVRSPRYF
ncbi:PorP/SprF family type IX secretion system membrane protein [Sunxiuqinia sp. A32]|uniref:PorP/SprF family type IX secretion system membrane protein n=1 Tax=Sunxiuqinia sp. A32 TaxID=3461496 RepID=UPI0040457DA1